MLSNKDINFDEATQIITINGKKYNVLGDPAIPGEIEDLNERVETIEQVTLDGKNLKMYLKTFNEEINIATAWGGLYVTNSVLDISYADLGLTERPAAVFLSVLSQSTAFFLMPIGFNEEKVSFHCVRTSSSTSQSATITALVVY